MGCRSQRCADRLAAGSGKNGHSGIGVGYFRFHQGKWTSNYLIISNQGEILLDYARMSPGWKIRDADPQLYREGTQNGIFRYHGKQIGILLCGDGWANEVVSAMASRQPDLVFWPVYVCFPLTEWKQEQTGGVCPSGRQLRKAGCAGQQSGCTRC